jgi:hypothetical protein
LSELPVDDTPLSGLRRRARIPEDHRSPKDGSPSGGPVTADSALVRSGVGFTQTVVRRRPTLRRSRGISLYEAEAKNEK